VRRLCAFLLSALAVSLAQGQDWPARPVRIIVPFPPGGAADALPRIVGELSAEPIAMAPAEMGRFLIEDAARWRDAIRAAGLKPGEL
jgi:tripartite-type tricarboxylate transporter receptor subunit TctC